jgi:hypothetical protein
LHGLRITTKGQITAPTPVIIGECSDVQLGFTACIFQDFMLRMNPNKKASLIDAK